MDRAREQQTLDKTHDLLDQSRRLLRELNEQIEHGDQRIGGPEDVDGVQGGQLADSQERFIPPRRPK